MMDISDKALRKSSTLLSLTRGVVDGSTDTLIVSWDGKTFGFGMDIFMVLTTLIALEVVMPALRAVDLRAGVTIEVSAVPIFGVASDIAIDMSTDVDANMRATRVTALESIPMLSSSEEGLLFACEPCSC